MKGIFEFEVGEPKQKIGFKFGTYAFKIACERHGDIDLGTLFRKCGFAYKEGGKVKTDKPKLGALLDLFYGAAVHYAEDNDLPIKFKLSTVSNWLDEIGTDQLMEMIQFGFQQYEPKNSDSPAKTGELATA